MKTFTLEQLKSYRDHVFRFSQADRLRSPEEAIRFVNDRGFIFFWPVTGFPYPSLWGAIAGDRPVPDNHDDPGHISWSWKDQLLDKRVWYYGRILKKRNTIISLDTIPYFYALSPNFGTPEEDVLDQYFQGTLPLEAKLIFETLLEKGPLDSLALRKESHLAGANSNTPYSRALDLLQKDLRVLPTAIAEVGTWRYAFVYDLTHRYYPNLINDAHDISEQEARNHLLKKCVDSLGALTTKEAASLFGWTVEQTQKSMNSLIQKHEVLDSRSMVDSTTVHYCSLEFEKLTT